MARIKIHGMEVISAVLSREQYMVAQAQVSMLIKHHQLMVRYDADHISPTTALSDSTHKPCDQCELKVSIALSCAEHQCKHNWVTLAAYGADDSDICFVKHNHLMII